MATSAESFGDPFEQAATAHSSPGDAFAALTQRRPSAGQDTTPSAPGGVGVATLHGFDLQDRPLVTGIAALPGQMVAARATVDLRLEHVGASVVLVFEHGDPQRPIVLGVLQAPASARAPVAAQALTAQVDDQRVVISAEREVVLTCGAASITLTRAGKVIIKGEHILSQSSGYNRIKGSAIDIN